MKTDMLFCYPPGGTLSSFSINLGASYVGAFLAEKGFNIYFYAVKEPLSISKHVENILDYSPRAIGFTANDTNWNICKKLIQEIKSKCTDTKIILGGPSATFLYKHILNDPVDIDLCVRYEGEIAIHLVLEALENKCYDLEQIPNIAYRSKEGKIIATKVDTVQNLDEYPSPYLTGILKGTEETSIISSRGCPFECVYCNFSAIGKGVVRYYSIDRVISEIKIIASTRDQGGIINIHDDCFSIDINRAKKIVKKIIDLDIDKKIMFRAGVRADRYDDELLELMGRANFKYIYVGLESAVPRILRNIKKVPHRSDDKTFEAEKNS